MIDLRLFGLAIALISTECYSQSAVIPPEKTASQNEIGTTPKPLEQVTQSEVCPNLINDYSESGRNPELVIYNNNSYKTYSIQQVDEALKFYFSEKQPEQPLLLYIHGRALGKTKIEDYDHEPVESLNDVFPEFSTKYNAKTVLMLHWPHKKVDDKGFPENDAKFAGKALVCVIQKLKSNDFNADHFPGFRSLITHSMGALVLEEALSKSSEDLHEFDAVAIFAAASRASDVGSWLSKIKAYKRYILINIHDVVLKEIKDRMNFIPLGMCDSNCFKDNQPIQTMSYIDITDIAGLPKNIRHNYFVKGNVADKVVTKILKGELPPRGVQGISENVRIIRKADI